LNDIAVSYTHAKITKINQTNFVLVDLSSKNGTLVNDRFVKSKLVENTDIIKIGQQSFLGQELIVLIHKELNSNRIQFFEEFQQVLIDFDQFQKLTKQINASFKQKVSIIRYGLPALLFILFLSLGEKLGIPQNVRVLIPLVGGGLASIFAERIFSQEDLKQKLQAVREEYSEKLVCPKCRTELINKSSSYWVSKRKCPRCNANWID
jgi:hypothetical protein